VEYHAGATSAWPEASTAEIMTTPEAPDRGAPLIGSVPLADAEHQA